MYGVFQTDYWVNGGSHIMIYKRHVEISTMIDRILGRDGMNKT